MSVLSNQWNRAAHAELDLSDDDSIPENDLAELDPTAYEQLLTRKAHKKDQEAFEDAFEQHELQVKTQQRKREEAAEIEAALIRADQWDHAKTQFGGRQMSQAEAQKVREHIVEHRSDVVDWGLRAGQFRTEAEGQAYVDRTDRLHKLNEAERAGKMSAQQRIERTRLEEQQRPYSAVDAYASERALSKGNTPREIASLQAPSELSSRSQTPASSANDDNPFRSRAPDMMTSFANRAGVTEGSRDQSLPEHDPITPLPIASRPLAMAGLS